MNLNNLFQNFCKKNNLEINAYQLTIVNKIESFYTSNFNKSIFKKFFLKDNSKQVFYLHGGVGVVKTMILTFFFVLVEEKKLELHFNKLMLRCHDIYHKRKENKYKNIIYQYLK